MQPEKGNPCRGKRASLFFGRRPLGGVPGSRGEGEMFSEVSPHRKRVLQRNDREDNSANESREGKKTLPVREKKKSSRAEGSPKPPVSERGKNIRKRRRNHKGCHGRTTDRKP